VVRYAGLATVLLSVFGLVLGLFLVESLSSDFRSSVSVSQSAIDAISETIEAVDDVADGTSQSLSSASTSVSGVSSTVDATASAIEGVADFLDQELPETLESVSTAMPAAIQAANAVDGTLRALSLFGVDYDPEEPFGESLSRIETALAALPDQLRTQSATLRLLIPSAAGLAEEADNLSVSIKGLTDSLDGFTNLTGSYRVTLGEARATIERTSESVDDRIWLIRIVIIVAGATGVAVGIALISMGRTLDSLYALTGHLDDPTTVSERTQGSTHRSAKSTTQGSRGAS
jgi:ABC-type transporter Mla subunit MlaD